MYQVGVIFLLLITSMWDLNNQVRIWSMREHRFTHQQSSPLVSHRHRIIAQPFSPDVSLPDTTPPLTSDNKLQLQPANQKHLQAAVLSELNPNIPNTLARGASQQGKIETNKAISPLLDVRKRSRTIRDYFYQS